MKAIKFSYGRGNSITITTRFNTLGAILCEQEPFLRDSIQMPDRDRVRTFSIGSFVAREELFDRHLPIDGEEIILEMSDINIDPGGRRLYSRRSHQ